ncbi:hypothetical protein PAECIP111891_05633 [Paenibacillus allorhizoplanae]|jgi:hypothetical protein|uniref:Uncharacterized protein n=1 Tax=Paenibacillus allorhizoplanae TaxID=2905648 RepID=A0ABN8H0U0_9BACL|nr:hypothetical protein PAECIP111891_05633 [Paenibacillus allorhizoplanae]
MLMILWNLLGGILLILSLYLPLKQLLERNPE